MGLFSRLANLFRGSSSYYYHASAPSIPRESVSEGRSFTQSAYWCCVRVISESLSQVPWRVHEVTDRGNKIADQHPADRLLHFAPIPWMEAAVWRELLVRWVLTHGNAYCEISRDASFRPSALWPIEPWRVEPLMRGGQLVYEVQQPEGGQSVVLPAADVLHFRGLGDELKGWSVLTYAANTLGLALSQEESMHSQMKNGARLSGILSPPGGGSFPKEKHQRLLKEWQAQYSGSRNHGKVYLLSQGLDYNAFSMPNTDAQLLESRRFSVLDICRFFRVPPHMVYDLERATFSNIEHQSIEFQRDSLAPWAVKMEQQATRKLISLGNQRRYYTKLNLKGWLRGDSASQAEYYTKLRDLGVLNPNEIAKLEDMNEIGPDGDLRLVPSNMQSLEAAGKEPEPIPAPLIPEGEEEGNGRAGTIRPNPRGVRG